MKPDTSPSFTYLLATTLLFPAALLFTIFVAIRYRSLKYLSQRLGVYTSCEQASRPVWLHCASVGEVNTALPLIRALSQKNYRLLISTSTITGQITLQNANLQQTSLIFLPLDYSIFAKQLIQKHQPKVLLIFETELWPSIILNTQNSNIPCAIINARLSTKTLSAPTFIKKNYAKLLKNMQQIFAGSNSDVDKFISLGANQNQIVMQDNLKFSTDFTTHTSAENPLSSPFILCASTRDGEEQRIISQWKRISGHTLVLAPRHPKRIKEVCKIIEDHGLTYVLHSRPTENISPTDIYLIDTLGELAPFMAHAKLVFVGGSLVPIGGHNVLEPASLAKCILVGPHTENIAQIVDELAKHKAITVVNNETSLISSIESLLTNDQQRTTLGMNAQNFVKNKKHVLPDYVTAISKFIDSHS